MYLQTCLLSALTIAPLNSWAISIATLLLPIDVGPTISAGQSVAMIGNTSLAGSSPDYAQAVVDAGMLSDPADRVVDTGITLDTGDGTAMEEFYRVNPVLPPVEDFEDTEAQKIQDTQYMINKGLLQKDLATGEIVEGPNVRHPETLEVVPRSSIEPEVTTGGDEIPYVSPVTQTDVTPPEDTGLTEAENRALIDAYGYGKTVPVDIQDLGPREISPLADQRMQRDYAENVRLMAEPRTLSAQGGRIGYYDGELVEDDDEETIRAQALASLPEYQLFSQRRKAMLGGRMGYNQGGIARQPFFVGKLVKAVTKPLKKIVKSPVGKLALLGGLGAWGLGAGPFANLPGQGFLKGNFMKKMLLNKAKEGGWEATKWKLANVAPWKATAGITYALGPISLGIQRSIELSGSQADTDTEHYANTLYGAVFNVNDDLSISYGFQKSRRGFVDANQSESVSLEAE